MSLWYEACFEVDDRDTDPFGQCRPSALMGFLQEAAVGASDALHVGRDELMEGYSALWMLARMRYRLTCPILRSDRLTVQTWHRGGRSALMYRDFDLFRDGVLVGEAVSAWVLADVETRRLLRMSLVTAFQNSDGGARCKSTQLKKIRVPDGLPLAERRRLGYSDADVNGHINNTRYADFACDALHLETLGEGRFPAEVQIGYLAESKPGECLRLYAGIREGLCYVRGLDLEDVPRFDAVLTLKDIT